VLADLPVNTHTHTHNHSIICSHFYTEALWEHGGSESLECDCGNFTPNLMHKKEI